MDGRDTTLTLGMNGGPLPFEHGFPVRRIVPVRATDRTGSVRTDRRTRTIPEGASGWRSVVVTVE